MSTEPEDAVIDATEAEAAFADDEVEVSEVSEEAAESVQPEATPDVATTEETLPQRTDDQIALDERIAKLESLLVQQSQAVDRVHGNYGEVNRELQAMRKAAATPQGAARFEPNDDAFAGLDEFDMPELKSGIAKGVAAEIERALSKAGGVSPDAIQNIIAEANYNEALRKREEGMRELDLVHPDRYELQRTEEYALWYSKMNPAKQQRFMNSLDPDYVSDRLDDFKKWRSSEEAQQEAKQNRLRSAVQPKGERTTKPIAISDKEAMQKAFDDDD